MGVKPTIAAILADYGVITSTEHPRLRSAMARLKRAGVLDNPLPGTFVLAADASERAPLGAPPRPKRGDPVGAEPRRADGSLRAPDTEVATPREGHPPGSAE